MSLTATAAVALAAVLDSLLGEPPTRVHPVAILGRAIAWLDRDWALPRLAGLAIALCLPLGVGALATGIVALASLVSASLAAGVAGLVLFATISRRMLLEEGRAVVTASATDLATARDRLPSLVGRDTSSLSPGEVRSAAVESLAENLADGLVAPLVAFALGALLALPVAAGAAAWVKAVNTLDSMVGYRDHPSGWASARLDDVVMLLPARLTACCLAVAGARPTALWRARGLARRPASPNSGWPMATLAVVHDLVLRKPGAYVLPGVDGGRGGHADSVPAEDLPSLADADRARRTVGRAGICALLLAGVVAWF
ncbi:MAG: adenosylcobinamide-phosphate synthase CbiB [Haloarculaceae archaeon]